MHGPHYDIDVSAFFTGPRRTRAERLAEGVQRREQVPLDSHATAPPLAERPDPIGILRAQESEREPSLVPLRYERMAASPFAFLRGAAAVMASDLSRVPSSGLKVQLCGDAHVSNFGMFASAERELVFDVNDFDETLPGPFDWDVKRLAASAAVAARDIGASDKRARKVAAASVRAYRTVMSALSTMPTLDVWNAKVSVDLLISNLGSSDLRLIVEKAGAKARRSTADTAVAKLTTVVDGRRRFRADPPLLIPVPEVAREEVVEKLSPVYEQYLRTLQPDRIALLAHYSFVDIAHKVVGVGSVGNLAIVLLLESGDGEPLVLQVKQANASVLEPYVGASQFDNHGKRVVVGQRVMQATGDPFLGWLRAGDDRPVDFYVRQLRDMKGSVDVATLKADVLQDYAQVCGAVLARAHARVADASAIAGYLGDTDEFDAAVAEFAMAYADSTVADHAALVNWRAQQGPAR
jgi:uncharacterized protein (DUF2252 family)